LPERTRVSPIRKCGVSGKLSDSMDNKMGSVVMYAMPKSVQVLGTALRGAKA
jgi:hypothetical protein